MAIPVMRVSSLPSIGLLTSNNSLESLDRRDELNSYIRESFAQRGGDRYFGSSDDRYYQVFSNTVRQYRDDSDRTLRRLRDALAVTETANIIRPCITERSLRNLPPVMYDSILSMPDMYRLFRRKRIQGWAGITPEDIKPKVGMYTRLLDVNGTINIKDDCDEQKFRWIWKPGDPELTAQQIIDIKRTREYVQSILDGTELDPTDLDEIRS